jgi:hypothetical protein
MLVRLRCEGELDKEFDINGNRVFNETFIEEFIGSIGNGSHASGLDGNRDGVEMDAPWSFTTAIGQILEHSEVNTIIAVRSEIVQALTEIIWVSLIITKGENIIRLRLARDAEILLTRCYWKY